MIQSLVHVTQLASRHIVLRYHHLPVFHQLLQDLARSLLASHLQPEAPQVDALLHHPAQRPVVLLVRVQVLIEARGHHALVGLHQVRPGLTVGQGAVQTPAALGREEGDEALTCGVRQGAPHELAPSQRLPVDFHLFTRAPGDGHGRRSKGATWLIERAVLLRVIRKSGFFDNFYCHDGKKQVSGSESEEFDHLRGQSRPCSRLGLLGLCAVVS